VTFRFPSVNTAALGAGLFDISLLVTMLVGLVPFPIHQEESLFID
jgi:hypothetical protein